MQLFVTLWLNLEFHFREGTGDVASIGVKATKMNDNPEHENGYCVVCGSRSSFRFDPTIITLQLQKAWGISDNVVEAFNRKESMFCTYCGASLRIRRLAAVLMVYPPGRL